MQLTFWTQDEDLKKNLSIAWNIGNIATVDTLG